jgi:hypothetical protein
MRRALAVILAVAAAGCRGGPEAADVIPVSTSDRSREILGLKVDLYDAKDHRETSGLRSWTFRIRNRENATVSLRFVPSFVSPEGRDLGGSSLAEDVLLPAGESRLFHVKAPSGNVERLVVRFELR